MKTLNGADSESGTEDGADRLAERIIAVTRSPQSTIFYRRAIRQLGEGIVEEELGELRYRMRIGEVRDPARYFSKLLVKRLCPPTGGDAGRPGSPALPKPPGTYAAPTAADLLQELRPRQSDGLKPEVTATLQTPYSNKAIPWATFLGPEFFTLSTNKSKSDRVTAKFRSRDGRVTEVPMIRGRMFPNDEERGILTVEEGRVLGAIECLWVEQGCQYARFENGSVICLCRVPIRRLAELLGWKAFGGRDLSHLKRKVINLKTKGFYLELDAVPELRQTGFKGYGFTLIDGLDLVDCVRPRLEQTTFRVRFSDPYSRQLLSRRVVGRSKELIRMRSELAFLIRLYLEPILMARKDGQGHSIGLCSLIRTLNLPSAGWHHYRSRRFSVVSKALQELSGLMTTDGRRATVGLRKGINGEDFVLDARLGSGSL